MEVGSPNRLVGLRHDSESSSVSRNDWVIIVQLAKSRLSPRHAYRCADNKSFVHRPPGPKPDRRPRGVIPLTIIPQRRE